MFVGHYAASFAAKRVEKRIPLWTLFIAAQGVDLLWAVLVLLGIEKVRITPGITAANPLDLYYYPYSHSLLASVLWLGLAAVVFRLLRPGEGAWRTGLIVGLAVFSHWVLDLLVHRPDLPLYDDSFKVGLGLWNYPLVSFSLEIALLLGGIWVYYRSTTPATKVGRYGMLALGILLVVIQAVNTFGPAPGSPAEVATTAIVLYIVLAGAAYWLDKQRR